MEGEVGSGKKNPKLQLYEELNYKSNRSIVPYWLQIDFC